MTRSNIFFTYLHRGKCHAVDTPPHVLFTAVYSQSSNDTRTPFFLITCPPCGTLHLSAVGQLRRGQGTIGYTPPEVMLGDLLPCAPNQDVYALGHMMLVLFAKRAYKSANMFTSNVSVRTRGRIQGYSSTL